MKIAILSYTSGKVNRGVETVVSELAKQWRKKHQVQVFSALSLGIDGWLKFNLHAIKEADKFGAQIIMPMNGGWQTLLARLYCWIKRKKMVVSGQAGLGWCDGWNLLMQPDVFVALSEANRRWAKKFYGRGVRVKVIPNGVNLQQFKPEGKKLALKLARPVILCVAAKEKYKRTEATLKAVKKIKGSLMLVSNQFQHSQMPEVYRSADAFTLVSDSTEAFGVVYLEALASGLTVVATDDELRREILGPYGIYVKDVWGNEYAAKLKLALKQPKFRPEKWLKKFSWEKVAQDYMSIFSSWRLE